jgi:hypothetical protein
MREEQERLRQLELEKEKQREKERLLREERQREQQMTLPIQYHTAKIHDLELEMHLQFERFKQELAAQLSDTQEMMQKKLDEKQKELHSKRLNLLLESTWHIIFSPQG